ncbi:MAG: hypothetical protein NTW01_00150 [Gammaproteobacteria bacterium]|nr:hypothetical protein [Gammaproteobacteria bacterium]
MPERLRWRLRGFGGAALLLGLALPLVGDAQSRSVSPGRKAPVQCWTDDRGQRACGDVVPPADARRERALIDPRGVVTQVLPAQKSPAQVEAEAKRAREDEQRQAYDRYLLQAYRDVPAIERARDERLAALDARRQLTEKAIADTRAALAELRGRQPASPANGAQLQARIDEFTAAEADQRKALSRLHDERARIHGDFDRDIGRFRELRQGSGG